VITESKGLTTLVASRRPPIPTSSTAISTPAAAKYAGKGGEALEKAGNLGQTARAHQFLGGVVHPEEVAGEIIVADECAADADALIDTLEMGRGVEAGSDTRFGEDGSEGRGGRALAIGSRDQDRGKTGLGIAQNIKQNANLIEGELPPRLARPGEELGRHGVQVIESRRVGHGCFEYRRRQDGVSVRLSGDGRGLLPRSSLDFSRHDEAVRSRTKLKKSE